MKVVAWIFLILAFAMAGLCVAAAKAEVHSPAALDPAEAARQGSEIALKLRSQKPSENSTNTGLVTVRAPGAPEKAVPVRFSALVTPTNWISLYEATPQEESAACVLKVVHTDGKPNEYWLQSGKPDTGDFRRLDGAQIMQPFAGSDFWVGDLGLEFLSWPSQRLLRKELKRSQSCDVLESSRPDPGAPGYAKVISWIDIDTGGIVLAEAYAPAQRRLKEFAPKELRKVQGQWELEEMEIRNRQTGSRTRIQFNLAR